MIVRWDWFLECRKFYWLRIYQPCLPSLPFLKNRERVGHPSFLWVEEVKN
jgi:hypothetical protein